MSEKQCNQFSGDSALLKMEGKQSLKMKQMEKMISQQQKSILRLMEQNKKRMQEASDKILSRDQIIRELQTKLEVRNRQYDRLSRRIQDYELQKKQENQGVSKLFCELQQMKQIVNRYQMTISQLYHDIIQLSSRISSIFSEQYLVSVECTLNNIEVQNSALSDLQHSKEMANWQSSASNLMDSFQLDHIGEILCKLSDKFTNVIEKTHQRIKALQTTIEKQTQALESATQRQKILNQQLNAANELAKKNRWSIKSYEEILKKNESEKQQLASYLQNQYQRIINSSGQNLTKTDYATLNIKIQQLERMLAAEQQEVIKIKMECLTKTQQLMGQIKKINASSQSIILQKWAQSRVLKN